MMLLMHFIVANQAYIMAGSCILLCCGLWEFGNG